MRDFPTARHTTKNRADPWVNQHLLCEDNKRVMDIMLWYGSGNAVQVCRSHAERVLSRGGLYVGEAKRVDQCRSRIRSSNQLLGIRTIPLFI